jgi:predicted  nucleic acid-binding Zn-ribbon protein
MPYLQNEKTRTQAQIQSAEAEVANLTAQEQAQQQAVAQTQAQVDAARSRLAGLQAQRPALEREAATADRRLADLEVQIEQHGQTEPEQFIERPNRPPLRNPEWTTWKNRLDVLTEQRNQAEASASATHSRLNDLSRAISQADAEVQSAVTRAAQAVATLAQLSRAISAARVRGPWLLARNWTSSQA